MIKDVTLYIYLDEDEMNENWIEPNGHTYTDEFYKAVHMFEKALCEVEGVDDAWLSSDERYIAVALNNMPNGATLDKIENNLQKVVDSAPHNELF